MQKLLDALESLDDVQEVYTSAVLIGDGADGASDRCSTTTPVARRAGASCATSASSSGEAIIGANIFRDMFAAVRDIVGGRAGAYENVLGDARAHRARRDVAKRPRSSARTRSSASTSTTRRSAPAARC